MQGIARIAGILTVIGAINWGLVGLFGIDIIGSIFGGPTSLTARTIYTLVGISGLICIPSLIGGGQQQKPKQKQPS
ncbi:MAG: hypothetical protein JWN15_1736 [Firmicutes bacterium]|nr:hypothetical protein [Bacillota bacterium]